MASTTALLLAGSAFFAYHLATARASIARNLLIQAETIGLNSVSPLRFSDQQAARETLSALRADHNILVAAIYSADGKVFAAYTDQTQYRAPVPPALVPVPHGASPFISTRWVKGSDRTRPNSRCRMSRPFSRNTRASARWVGCSLRISRRRSR